MVNILAVIPARYGSTRFPGKPLAQICGKPMIQWVYEHAAACSMIDQVIVATDHQDIVKAVEDFDGNVCMTAVAHATGTDRVAEVAGETDARIIINVQGDEPLLPPQAIEQALHPLLADSSVTMATLKTRMGAAEDIASPHVVKVITDRGGRALYFSRSPIPYFPASGPDSICYRHIGLYAYRREFLFAFTALPRSPLEKTEGLEQLRALEYGYPIMVAETDYYPVGVDTPEDIARVEALLAAQGCGQTPG